MGQLRFQSRIFLGLYLVAISFSNVLNFPLVGRKIQPPELVFIIGFPLILRFIQRSKPRLFPLLQLDLILLGYLLVVFFSAVLASELKSILEVLGVAYLFLVYVIVSLLIQQEGPEIVKTWVVFPLLIGGGIGAIAGDFGWIMTNAGINTRLAWPSTDYYPYFGYVGRSQGFTTNPNMLESILAVSTLLVFSGLRYKNFRGSFWKIMFFFLLASAFLTFSKMLLGLFSGLILVWYWTKENPGQLVRKGVYGAVSILVLFLVLATHILVARTDNIQWEELKKSAYTADHAFFDYGGYSFIATNYTINKLSSLRAGFQHILFGVGPGQHNAFVAGLKKEGLYPEYFTNYDPHSTYFGAFGELGLLGIIAVLLLAFSLSKSLRQLWGQMDKEQLESYLIIAITACFFVAGVEGISTDIMNFRHYWVLLGILSGLLRSKTITQSP